MRALSKQNNVYPSWEIIIVDQNPTETKLNYYQGPYHYIPAPYNCGLSTARNLGVEYAKNLECDYVLLGSDSFLFNESLNWIDCLCKELGTFKLTSEHTFDLIGFELSGCICGWEAKLNLIEGQGFELNFIDKENSDDFYSNFHPYHCRIYRCDITRNFFLATTESLLNVKWDDNLKLGEYSDWFFWLEVLKAGYVPTFWNKPVYYHRHGHKRTLSKIEEKTFNKEEFLRRLEK